MQLPIPLTDLSIQHHKLKDKLQIAFSEIFESSRYILGPNVSQLETRLKGFCQTTDCVSCASGTDALQLALHAIDIQPGDEVVVPSLTFIAPAQVIARLKAKPVFVDIDPETYLMQASSLEAVLNQKTKAIIAVSLFGQVPDFNAINQIAKPQGVTVVEDAAQSFGAVYQSKKSCNLADFGCTSFYPSKPLGCYGDGGAVFTNQPHWAKKLRSLRMYGVNTTGLYETLGMNSRLDELQAAVLLAKMDLFETEIKLRAEKAEVYAQLIRQNIPADLCQPPILAKGTTSVYAQYIVQVPKRDAVLADLHQNQVQAQVYYNVPCHLQPCFEPTAQKLPNTEKVAQRILSLPFSPYIDYESQAYVVDCLKKAVLKV